MANPNPTPPPEETRWKKGQSGNPNGRKPKLISGILNSYKEQGYEIPAQADIYNLMVLMGTLEKRLIEELANDETQPIMLRIIARQLLSKKGTDMLKEIFDRQHGKPHQTTDLTTGGDKLTIALVKYIGQDDSANDIADDRDNPNI